MKNNVSEIVRNNLCIQCGTCESVCPEKAITISEFRKTGLLYPKIYENLCNDCGLCLRVCPVNDFSIFTEPLDNYNSIGIFNVNTNGDPNHISSSGGTVTEIIKFLFQQKLITKAIVSVLSEEDVLEAKAILISNENETEKSRGSIYQPVSVNRILKRISNNDKVAMVGLPCHMRGLHNYLKINTEINIIYKVGIFCNIGRAKNATRSLIDTFAKKKKDKIKKLYYRKGEYPGSLNIEFDNESISIPFNEYMTRIGYFFTPKGCLFCDDLFNELADISVGDPWGLVNSKKSIIITRNEKAEELIQMMLDSKILTREKLLQKQDVLNSQNYAFKNNRAKRGYIYKKIGFQIPSKMENEITNTIPEKITLSNLLLSIVLLVNSYIFNSRFYYLSKLIPYKFLNRIAITIKKSYKSDIE